MKKEVKRWMLASDSGELDSHTYRTEVIAQGNSYLNRKPIEVTITYEVPEPPIGVGQWRLFWGEPRYILARSRHGTWVYETDVTCGVARTEQIGPICEPPSWAVEQ